MKEDCSSRSHYYLARGQRHRVDRVLGYFSSRRNWDTPTQPAGVSARPPFGSGGDTLARGRGEGPNSDEGPVYVYFVYRGRVNIERKRKSKLGPLSCSGH
jgi:hypothetical protein